MSLEPQGSVPRNPEPHGLEPKGDDASLRGDELIVNPPKVDMAGCLAGLLDECEVHGRIVGHDFGMKVVWGEPNEGYSFLSVPPTIRLDPARALADLDECLFAIGHEGAHRYNTYSFLHPDLKPVLERIAPIEVMSRAIGFNAVFGGIEDPTINTWYAKVYPGSRERAERVYAGYFKEDGAQLYTPEIWMAQLLLGSYPKFGQYVSAVIRKWCIGDWGSTLDPQVERALQDTSASVDAMIALTDPSTGAPEATRMMLCLRRYILYLTGVWPVVKELVAEDINEAGFQAFKKFLEQLSSNPQNPRPGQEGSGDNNAEGKNGPGGEQHDAPSDDDGSMHPKLKELLDNLPDDERARLKQLLDALRNPPQVPPPQAKNDPGDQPQQSQPQAPQQGSTQPSQQGTQPQSGQGSQSDVTGGSEKGASQGSGAESGAPGDPSSSPGASSSPSLPSKPGSAQSPVPSGTPADPLDGKLREIYARLFPSARGGFEERGRVNLKEFDDALNRFLRSNLDPFPVPTHSERAQAADRIEQQAQAAQRNMKLSRDLDNYRIRKMGFWEEVVEKYGEQLVQLTTAVRAVLRPTAPKVTGGHLSGIGVSPDHAMRDEARPMRRFDVFEQSRAPLRRSYFFQFLADRSHSMKGSGKRAHCLAAIALGSEAIQRANTPFEIAAFDTSFAMLKERAAAFGDAEKEAAGQAILMCSGGTSDYLGIARMIKRARQVSATHRVLFVVTDGRSNDARKLERAIKLCSKHGIIVVGFGIGSETSQVDTAYPNGRGLLNLSGFGSEGSFIEYFVETLRAIVERPHTFRK